MKIIDSCGEMLAQKWETHVTTLVNAENEQLTATFRKIKTILTIPENVPGRVFVARDTRPSGVRLLECLQEGVKFARGDVIDLGYLTTPQLHFMLWDRCFEPERYFDQLSAGFKALVAGNSMESRVFLDCACGIAALKLDGFNSRLPIQIVGFNNYVEAHLNENCGADYVKIKQCLPVVHYGDVTFESGRNYASVDGDADRLVYYYIRKGQFRLLDGDKIAALMASFIIENLENAKLKSSENGDAKLTSDNDITLGVIQTAYANGSSTRFLNSLGVPVICVPTGVKYLHHEALKYDIGVYFEANGHGTVLFSDRIKNLLEQPLAGDASDSRAKLLALMRIMNQATGDAFSLLLAVEAVLALTHRSIEDWDGFYEDLPCLQLKVNVADRFVIEVFDAERKVSKPVGLQTSIDASVTKFGGRAFVRPSGTENVVRVYAEAHSPEATKDLALEVARAVYDMAVGVGIKP